MASISIPWNDGPGNIVLTYTGQDDGVVTVTSDTDNLGKDRRQTVTFVIADGAIHEALVSNSNHQLVSSDGHSLCCLDAAMKLSVEVIQPTGMKLLISANNHRLVSLNGRELWCHPST